VQVLVDNYDIKPITTAENDLNAILCPGGDVECIKGLAA
jgi:hypothetical protein